MESPTSPITSNGKKPFEEDEYTPERPSQKFQTRKEYSSVKKVLFFEPINSAEGDMNISDSEDDRYSTSGDEAGPIEIKVAPKVAESIPVLNDSEVEILKQNITSSDPLYKIKFKYISEAKTLYYQSVAIEVQALGNAESDLDSMMES